MTDEELRRLRGHYHALVGHDRTLAAIPSTNATDTVDAGVYRIIEAEAKLIESAFPGLLPAFNRNDFFPTTSVAASGFGCIRCACMWAPPLEG